MSVYGGNVVVLPVRPRGGIPEDVLDEIDPEFEAFLAFVGRETGKRDSADENVRPESLRGFLDGLLHGDTLKGEEPVVVRELDFGPFAEIVTAAEDGEREMLAENVWTSLIELVPYLIPLEDDLKERLNG